MEKRGEGGKSVVELKKRFIIYLEILQVRDTKEALKDRKDGGI